MDPKLLCPTLTIMLTKTIKALCEVNIKFEKKLEISGSLHVRSDGEKILTCLIDEDSTRTATGGLIQQRSTPETALAQQSAVMALLTASQQMAANRSPGLISPPARNNTPGDNSRSGGGADNQLNLTIPHIQTNQNKPTQPSTQASMIPNSTQEPMMMGMEHLQLPPVNSFIQHKHDREVLLGMLQDKTKKSNEPLHNSHAPIQVNVKKEPIDPQHKTLASQHHSHHNPQQQLSQPHQQPTAAVVIATTAAINQQQQQQPSTQQQTATTLPHQQITTAMNGGLPPLAQLPPFPVLVGGTTWPSPQNIAAIAAGSGTTAKPPTPKSDPDSPPRENEYVTTINSKGQKKFQCMFCGILLSTKNYLKNHINAVHTKARVYPCEICERYFYSAGALRIHKLRHHWAGSKKHKCAHCHESFLLPVELRRHLVKKHGDTTGGHSEDENGEVTRNNAKSDGTSGLTIQQIHQMQLREQLRAQQHIYEQEQAIHNLQKHMSDQNSPVELSVRGDSLSEEREPGELLNDEMHSHMTTHEIRGINLQRTLVPLAIHEVPATTIDHDLQALHQQPPAVCQVIVEPEAPPDVVHEDMDEELHPNQNEIGIPDEEVHEIHEVTLEEVDAQSKNRVQVEYVQQSQTVGDGGD